jgi:transposase
VKAYQRRRRQAIAMRAKGTALREIAKTLNSDVPTVKRWVGETQKEK